MTSRSRVSYSKRLVQVFLGLFTASGSVVIGTFLALWYRSKDHSWFDFPAVFWILGSLVLFLAMVSIRLLSGCGASTGNGLLSPAGYCAVGGLVLFSGVLVIPGLAPIEPLRAAILAFAFLGTGVACFAVARRRAKSARTA